MALPQSVTMLLALRIAAGLAGSLAYYVAFFMFEGELGEWQSKVETLWVTVSDRQRIAGGKFPALLGKVAEIVTRIFNRVLGRKLLSFQLVRVSLSSSLASMFLGLSVIVAGLAAFVSAQNNLPSNITPDTPVVLSQALRWMIAAAVCLALAALPSIWRSKVSVVLSLFPGMLITYAVFRAESAHRLTANTAGAFVAFVVALLSDILFLLVVRLSIRQLAKGPTLRRIIAAIALRLEVPCCLWSRRMSLHCTRRLRTGF